MCGRYVLKVPFRVLVAMYRGEPVGEQLELAPRYNIAPSQSAPVVREGAEGRELVMMRWGLVPPWAKDPKRVGAGGSQPPINARAETASTSRVFKDAMQRRRCLVPADGFYAILTTRPNAEMASVHDRMPVILPASAWDQWLDPKQSYTEDLAPLPDGAIQLTPVSTRVNSPRNDSPDCIEAAPDRSQLGLWGG